MSKKGAPRKVNLAAVLAERKQKHKPVEIEMPDGSSLFVPVIETWDDELVDLADADRVAAVRKLLGDEYERFRAACAEAGDGAAAVLSEIVLDRAGASSPGE